MRRSNCYGRYTSFQSSLLDRRAGLVLLLAITVMAGACAGDKGLVPPGTVEPDKFLFERGSKELSERKWLRAREYFRRLVDTFPQSPHRPDAKLGIGDTLLGEDTAESSVAAIGEFREFLTFYPTHPRADYAQYKLGLAHYGQMLGPERDQSETREALKEFDTFLERYPNSPLAPEVRAKWREVRDRLSESEFRIGLFYYRSQWYPGAIDRFQALLKMDPKFTGRDAVYYYLAEALLKSDRKPEALPYYARLLDEFQRSEYLEEAKQRVAELKKES